MRYAHFYFISFLFASTIICGCYGTSEIRTLQKSYIPNAISNVYIGMSLKQLKEARGIVNLSVVESVVTKVREEYKKDSITLITYQFDKNKILYEIMIEHIPEFDATAYYKIKYGEFNNGKEWLFTLNKKMKLKIWVYLNSLCIADSEHFKN